MRDLLLALRAAGFRDVEFCGETPVRTSKWTRGVLVRARAAD